MRLSRARDLSAAEEETWTRRRAAATSSRCPPPASLPVPAAPPLAAPPLAAPPLAAALARAAPPPRAAASLWARVCLQRGSRAQVAGRRGRRRRLRRRGPRLPNAARLEVHGSATSRLHRGYIAATSRLHLGYISATSRLHLASRRTALRASQGSAAPPTAPLPSAAPQVSPHLPSPHPSSPPPARRSRRETLTPPACPRELASRDRAGPPSSRARLHTSGSRDQSCRGAKA